MIYSIQGVLALKGEGFVVIKTGLVGYKIFVAPSTLATLAPVGEEIELLTYMNVKEDAQDLFGFLTEKERSLFEALIGISGVGPKSALNIMGIENIDKLVAAINEGRSDLLARASGVGKKTAERITLELKGKLTFADTSESIGQMERDIDLEETLVNLGFSRAEARSCIEAIDDEVVGFNDRLKEALKNKDKTNSS